MRIASREGFLALEECCIQQLTVPVRGQLYIVCSIHLAPSSERSEYSFGHAVLRPVRTGITTRQLLMAKEHAHYVVMESGSD